MNRLLAERREQLIEAALAVASRDGIDAATVRAVAAEAGVSLGVVHYCFQDKDELLRAMAHAITSANLERSLGDLPEQVDDPQTVIEGVLDALWAGIRGVPRPAAAQLRADHLVLRHSGSTRSPSSSTGGSGPLPSRCWTSSSGPPTSAGRSRGGKSPRRVAVIDGYSLAWLVDGDSDAARAGLLAFGRYLSTMAVPVALEPVGADARRCRRDVGVTAPPPTVSSCPWYSPRPRRDLGRLCCAGLRLRGAAHQPRGVQGPVRRRRRADHARRPGRVRHGCARHADRRPGRPVERRERVVLGSGLAIVAASVVVAAVAPGFALLAAGFAVYGVGLGMVDAGTNMQAVAVQREYGRSLLTGFYASWSAGGIVGAVLVAVTTGRTPTDPRGRAAVRDARGRPRGRLGAAERVAGPRSRRGARRRRRRPTRRWRSPWVRASGPWCRRVPCFCSGSGWWPTTWRTRRSPPGAPSTSATCCWRPRRSRPWATPRTSRRRSPPGWPATPWCADGVG